MSNPKSLARFIRIIGLLIAFFAAILSFGSNQAEGETYGTQAAKSIFADNKPVANPSRTFASAQACPDSMSLVVMQLLNQLRVDSGVSPLLIDQRLVASSQAHAEDMFTNDCFQADACDGNPWFMEISSFGYPTPNSRFIAVGVLTAEAVVALWMTSAATRDILFERVGIPHLHFGAGWSGSGGGISGRRWTVDFGSSTVSFEAPACLSCCDNPGDANNDGTYNIADITFGIARIFAGGAAPACNDEADANGNNTFNIADITYGIARIFAGGPAPVCGTTGS